MNQRVIRLKSDLKKISEKLILHGVTPREIFHDLLSHLFLYSESHLNELDEALEEALSELKSELVSRDLDEAREEEDARSYVRIEDFIRWEDQGYESEPDYELDYGSNLTDPDDDPDYCYEPDDENQDNGCFDALEDSEDEASDDFIFGSPGPSTSQAAVDWYNSLIQRIHQRSMRLKAAVEEMKKIENLLAMPLPESQRSITDPVKSRPGFEDDFWF